MDAHHHHHHHHHHELMDEKTSSSTTSFCYSDVVVHPHHNLGFSNHGVENFESNTEIYNLTSGIEMIGFQPKNQNLMVAQQQQQQQEMGFMDESSLRPCVFPCEGNERPSQGLSLSLSSSNPSTISLQSFELRHNNSRDLGFMRKLSQQSFHQQHQHQHQQQQHQQQQQQQQVFLGSSSSCNMSMQFEMMRSSKYMGPTQELLKEFCNLGTKQNNHDDPTGKKHQQLSKKNKHQWEELQDQAINNHDHHHHLTNHSNNTNNNNNNNNNNNSVINDSNNNASSSTSRNVNPSLYGVSLMELQKRKTKLLAMLEELDKRYKHYCEQMKGVVCSFEAVAGPGAADVYSALASKAMSRHFRCLRDAIVAQIMSTKKAMGEKDANNNNASILGTTKGETPRLRVLDQNLRQQRAYQQMTMMESHPWRPQRGLPERSVSILRAWLFEHFLHPYPSDVDKHILARQTGLSRGQVSNWFINARVRLWKPMVEQMYLEETKEDQDTTTLMGSSSDNNDHLGGLIQPPPPQPPPPPDQKPNHDQLIRIIDHQDSLSSIINTTANTTPTTTTTTTSSNPNLQQSNNHYIGRIIQVENFGGSMDNNHLNFASSSSYNHAAYGTNQNDNNAPQQGFGGGNNNNNNNVSLTLGLQQHGGSNNGVSLAFSPSSHTAAASLFYGRDQMEDEDCQPVHQFSLLEGDHQTQNNLPYRNLMGAQVLHDFA